MHLYLLRWKAIKTVLTEKQMRCFFNPNFTFHIFNTCMYLCVYLYVCICLHICVCV